MILHCLPAWLDRAPIVVAERLRDGPDPVESRLAPGPPAEPREVAGALARTLSPPEADDDAPPWLRREQRVTYRRALASLARYRGAMIATPVGSGKTFVALAVAAAMNRRAPTVCFAPAALLAQWRLAAREVGVQLVTWSLERASRGTVPAGPGKLAIVDESHHLRNPGTRRYGVLARWLVGRSALLLTATPVVNSLSDIVSQLALTVRDDALTAHGVASLREAAAGRALPSAYAELIVADSVDGIRPEVSRRYLEGSGFGGAPMLERLDGLTLSRHPPVAALVRVIFWRAAASSPAALAAALERYRALLRQWEDARRAGRTLSRAALRRFAGADADQLVMWELIDADGQSDLSPDDLPRIGEIIELARCAAARDDDKVARLRELLGDRRRTLVFATAPETVEYLRDRLGGNVAWCTGARAGVGRSRVSRAAVLATFGSAPRAAEIHAATTLVATDVAAEGLNLQRAERVVHYDLPWTPHRLEQREGRSRRLGAAHTTVEVIRFLPPPELEYRLKQQEILAEKAELGDQAGIGAGGRWLWRWRGEIAREMGTGRAVEGTTAIRSTSAGALAGVAIVGTRGSVRTTIAGTVVWIDEHGVTEEPSVIATRLEELRSADSSVSAPSDAVDAARRAAAAFARSRLRALASAEWELRRIAVPCRELLARLDRMARDAARNRDAPMLDRVERAVRLASGGLTAGETAQVADWLALSDVRLVESLARMPEREAPWRELDVRLTGLAIFITRV